MHGLTPRLHSSPACLPGPSLLYCDHGPRSPSSLSAAVTSGTGRAALFLPSNALVSRISPRCGYNIPQPRRRRCGAFQGSPGHEKKDADRVDALVSSCLIKPGRINALSRVKCPVSRTNSGFSRGLPSCPGLSRVSQLRCPRTMIAASFLMPLWVRLIPNKLKFEDYI